MLEGKWMLFLFFLLNGCMVHTKAVPLADSKDFKIYWLKRDLYGGRFYDDDRYRLLSFVSGSELKLLKSPLGHWITPPASDEKILAGTRVVVRKTEWPSDLNLPTRPLFTPRHLVWVYLTVAMERGFVRMEKDKTYILLAPDHIQSKRDFEFWWEQYFSDKDINWERLERKLSFVMPAEAGMTIF